MEARRPGTALLAAIALAAAGACSKEVGTSGDTKQTVGAKIDRALDRTQEKLERAGEKAREEIAEATEKTQETLSKAGEKISRTASSTITATTTVTTTPANGAKTGAASPEARDKLGDAAITASIKADFLKDPDLSVLKIDVDTRDGVVTLNGLADNDAAKTRAERIAQAVKGVKEVRNYLTIKRV